MRFVATRSGGWAAGLLLGTLFPAGSAARAQTPAQPARSAQAAAHAPAQPVERKQARALRLEGAAPQIDGRLDDAAWAAAPVISDFTQRAPNEGAAPVEKTEVRILYDRDALYVGARMYSADPRAIAAPVSQRDAGVQAEYVLVSLDTYLDRRTAYTFGVTAAGVRLDWYHPSDSRTRRDYSFDPVWEAKTRTDSAGWTAEMRIPYAQLRFSGAPVQTWGLNLARWNPSRHEDDYWIVVPTRETGWSSRFGDLAGIEGMRSSRRIELLPYVASGAAYTAHPGVGNPFDDGSRMNVRVGGDAKMGIGPNLTLEATVNPDFGQVEADPAEVNLTAFESFFAEKRPFFIEGNQLLSGDGPVYFYSRRIGAAPVGPASGDFVDYPNTSTILGAAKLTGRLRSGTSVGALAALTDRETARVFDAETGETSRLQVAPRTGYGVLRVQQQFGRAGSTAGLSLTGVRRDLSRGDALAGLLTRNAFSGGGDWTLRFNQGEYEVAGFLGFSYVGGDSAAIIRTQRSSARYFQRPDAGYVRVDSSRTSLAGYTAHLGITRNAGRHWLWQAFGEAVSPGFELNDAGIVQYADELFTLAQVHYRETKPGKTLRNYDFSLAGENLWNYGGVRNLTSVFTDNTVTWKNFWTTSFLGYVDLRAQSDQLTRGGPLMGTGWAWFGRASLANSASAPRHWTVRAWRGWGETGERRLGMDGSLSVRTGPQWQLTLTPAYSAETTPRQYVTSRAGGPAETFGRRYVFSFIDRRTVSTQLRLDYTVTPELSFTAYGEPFAASGRYYGFGELPAPGSRALRVYGTDGTTAVTNPDGSVAVTDGADAFTLAYRDFNVLSFRSNVVLKWDWRLGSTVYLVWQQNREADEATSDRVGPGSLFRSVEPGGDNTFAVKVTYWLPVH